MLILFIPPSNSAQVLSSSSIFVNSNFRGFDPRKLVFANVYRSKICDNRFIDTPDNMNYKQFSRFQVNLIFVLIASLHINSVVYRNVYVYH